jgi:hypothetical protein
MPPKEDLAFVAVVLLCLGGYFAVTRIGPSPERVPGLRAAFAKCEASDEEKREIARVFNDDYAVKFAAHIRASKTITTAQQASRVRHAFAKEVFAGKSYCNNGCRFHPLAEISTPYLAHHLGVAKDYKLDDPCHALPGFTWREKWARVNETLGIAHMECAP